MGTILNGSEASHSRYYMGVYHLAGTKSSRKVFQSLENRSYHNMVWTHPYAHPQHMKVVIHLSYGWSGCGNHLEWVWSLNQGTTWLFITWQAKRVLGKFSKAWRIGAITTWYGHIHMHIHSIWSLPNTLYTYLTLIWKPSWMGLKPQSRHYMVVYHLLLTKNSRTVF